MVSVTGFVMINDLNYKDKFIFPMLCLLQVLH